MDDVTKLIQALSVAAWPALVFYVVWNYRKQVASVIESARGRKFVIEIGGQKLSMEEANEQQQNLIADLQSQLLELRKRVEGFQVSPEAALAASPAVALGSNAILWVDDNPKNNSFFIDQLQKHGYRVDLALSTKEGLSKIDRNAYRLVLSDMGRTEEGQYVGDAGIVLLKELRKRQDQIPVVFFCSAQAVRRFRDQIRELGGRAITSSTTELRAVLDELAPAISA